MAYATTAQLASRLQVNEAANTVDLQRALDAAALEINSEIGYTLDISATDEELALAGTVNIQRAQDLWTFEKTPVGIIGMGGETPLMSPRDSWARFANMLLPLKEEWGLA